jgi:hypothetical protein
MFARSRMEGIKGLLALYMNPKSKTYNSWGASSCQISITFSRGRYCACQLRKLARQFTEDCRILPVNPYGNWNESVLVDEDLVNDINLYLQELGSTITARKLADVLSHEDVKLKHGITCTIRERTARRYMKALGYRLQTAKKCQYVDMNERMLYGTTKSNSYLNGKHYRIECITGQLKTYPSLVPKFPVVELLQGSMTSQYFTLITIERKHGSIKTHWQSHMQKAMVHL